MPADPAEQWIAAFEKRSSEFSAARAGLPPLVYVTLRDGKRWLAAAFAAGPGDGFITIDAADPDPHTASKERVRADRVIGAGGPSVPWWYTKRALCVRLEEIRSVELVHVSSDDLAELMKAAPKKRGKKKTTTAGATIGVPGLGVTYSRTVEHDTAEN